MTRYNGFSFIGATLMSAMLLGCNTTPYSTPEKAEETFVPTIPNETALRIATWNVEHLAYPIDQGCRPRTEEELAALQAYARNLKADIVGLQEVASYEAVDLLFPASEWHIIVSERPDSESYECRGSGFSSTQQKVAFAVRKSFDVKKVQQLSEFGLDSRGLRYGLEIDVQTSTSKNSAASTISVLNLHMKSGCFVDNYSRKDSDACQTFSRQAPILETWVDQKEQQGAPYFIVGDFNHRLSAPYNHLTQALLTDKKGNRNSLINTGAQLIGCHPYYPAPIDHIFAGNLNSADWQFKTQSVSFDNMQVDAMLSDHCAIVSEVTQNSLDLTNSVKWLTTSKEYQALTRTVYQQARQSLKQIVKPGTPWVVVMDIDETVLDNSAYQVRLDKTGKSYTPTSWAQWVKSEQATLTPGAAEFMKDVVAQGGKLALVTNREARLDAHTWRNLLALELPLTFQNTCLMGRSQIDIDSIDGQNFVNDKDLRRSNISSGKPTCFNPEHMSTNWQTSHSIIMQIGDNIEDFSQVTQEHADIDALLLELNKTFFLLPNPMYGSW